MYIPQYKVGDWTSKDSHLKMEDAKKALKRSMPRSYLKAIKKETPAGEITVRIVDDKTMKVCWPDQLKET